MTFCQLGRAQSLREIEQGLASAEGRLQQLGVTESPKRSTLAYANAHRPWQLYQSVFHELFSRCQSIAPGHRFRFKSKLLSLDSTTIDLCAEVFDWAKFRRTKGAVFTDAEGREYVFLTNRLDLVAGTIAEIYRQRWQIESFFKAIKQNLRIKTLVGTSENALHIQIWTALIAILMLRYLQLRAKWNWSLSNLIAMIRLNLFTYRDLWRWLDDPFTPPDVGDHDPQLSLLDSTAGGVVLASAI